MRDKSRYSSSADYKPVEKYIFPGPRITMTRTVTVSLVLIVSMYFGFFPRDIAINDLGGQYIVDLAQIIFYIYLIYSLYLCFWILLCILIIHKNLKHLMVLEGPEECMSPRQFRNFRN